MSVAKVVVATLAGATAEVATAAVDGVVVTEREAAAVALDMMAAYVEMASTGRAVVGAAVVATVVMEMEMESAAWSVALAGTVAIVDMGAAARAVAAGASGCPAAVVAMAMAEVAVFLTSPRSETQALCPVLWLQVAS